MFIALIWKKNLRDKRATCLLRRCYFGWSFLKEFRPASILTRSLPRAVLYLNTHGLGCVCGRVIKNPIAVITGNDFRAASHVGHYLRPQSHVASRARAVARFGHGDAVADARSDAFVHRADWL